jgi:hypothetical protein
VVGALLLGHKSSHRRGHQLCRSNRSERKRFESSAVRRGVSSLSQLPSAPSCRRTLRLSVWIHSSAKRPSSS